VIHVHAFAEEMNKSRRAVAAAARALADDGWTVLLIDLAGCGDSSGDFGEATWQDWVDDTLFAHQWITEQFGGPAWLWGLRAGCLIAAQASARVGGQVPLLLWQPALSGRQHLNQFLRLQVASRALGGDEGESTSMLRSRLASGNPLEIAGYVLDPRLAAGLEQAELRLDAQRARVALREVNAGPVPKLAPATIGWIARARSRGLQVDAMAIAGPPFWNTVEVIECPALVDATVKALEGSNAGI
jgi:exosortase A-associated hydrolase 2